MSSFPINNTQYLYTKRANYVGDKSAVAQNGTIFSTSPFAQTADENSLVSFQASKSTSNANSETSELRQSLIEIKSKQGFIGKLWDGFKNLTGIGAGSSKAEKAITDYENGKISKEEMEKAVNGYAEGQKMVVDVVADMASGILAMGAFALAVPTGGASLAVGLGLATAVGAGSKILIKGGDALLTGKEYSGKDLLYDTVTGGINGVLAPVTNGIGNTVTKTIGAKLGLTIVKEGAEEVVEQGVKQGVKQGLKSIVLNQTTDVVGGTITKRAVALGAGMAVDGALGGAADNMVRAGLNGENVLEAGVQGAFGGLIMAPVIGGGFRVAGKAGRALGNKINTSKTLSSEVAASKVLPDSAPTKIQGELPSGEKKMMRISLQFFGKKTVDEVSDVAKTIDDKVAKAMDLPSGAKSVDEIGFRGQNEYHLSQEAINKGTSYLAALGTPEYGALSKLMQDEFVIIPNKESAINIFRQEYVSLGLKSGEEIIVLNPNDIQKAANKKIGTSNAYMCEWYIEANGLTGVPRTRADIQNAINSSSSKNITIIVPDDFAGSGRSMCLETARTLNDVEIPENKKINLVFSPMVKTEKAQDVFNAVGLMDLDALQKSGSLNSGDDIVMKEFFEKHKGKIVISTPNSGTLTANPYYQTEYFMRLQSEDPELAQAIEAILTCNGTGKGYGRNGASGVLVATPTIDGLTLKCPNNNVFGAVPYALSQGATPETIKLPGSIVVDGNLIKNTGRWHNYLKNILEQIQKTA